MSRATLVRLMILVACMVMTFPSEARAQGTSGAVPEPMGLREATALIGRHATLDGATRLAIETAHDRYLEAFSRFRDGDVRKFLDLMQQVQGVGGGMPELTLLDRFLDEWRDMVEGAGRIDDAFFADLGASIAEDDWEAVERARRVRARQRHLGSMSMMGGLGGAGSLDQVFWDMPPTPEEVAATDQVFRAYEIAMPALAEEIATSQVGMIRSIAASLVEQGFGDVTPEDMQDPKRMQAMMAAVQAAMASASAEMLEARSDAEERELVATRGLRTVLSPDRWWRLKRAWIDTAFPMAGLGWSGGPEHGVPRHAGAILDLIDDAEARAEVERIRDTWFVTDDRLTDEAVEFARGLAAQELGVAAFDPEADPRGDLGERRARAANDAIDAMLARIEDESVRSGIAATISKDPGGVAADLETIPGEGIDAELERDAWERAAARSRSAEGVPTPMTVAEFELIMDLLALDDVERTTARVLHEDLLERWSATIDPIIDRAYGHPQYDEQGMPVSDGMKRVWNDLRQALDATRRLDREFLDDLEATFGDEARSDAVAAARLQRAFGRMASMSDDVFGGSFGMPVVEPVSPYALIDGLDLQGEPAREAMAALVSAHAALRPAVEGWEDGRFAHDRDQAFDQLRFMARQSSLRDLPPDEQMAAMAAESQRMVRDLLSRLDGRRRDAAGRRAIIESVLAEHVLPVMSPIPVLELKVAMLDAGRAGRVGDDTALEVTRRVLRLHDLDEGQVAVIESMLQDHLEGELALVEAITAATTRLAEVDHDATMEQSMQRQMAVENEMQKFGFRRDEMRERLLQRFLSVLTPVQIARIPALQERAGR